MKTTEQQSQLKRTSSNIAEAIKLFFLRCAYTGKLDFNISALYKYVAKKVGGKVAPGSPDRVMRALRNEGKLNYELVSRSSSQYRVLGVTV